MGTLTGADRDLVARTPVFQRISPDERPSLLDAVEVVEHASATTVIAPESHHDDLLIVLDGQVEVVTTGVDETTIVLTRLERGGCFGEQGLVADDGTIHGAAVIAATDVRCALLPWRLLDGPAAAAETGELDDASITDLRAEMMASIEVLADVELGDVGRGVSEVRARIGEEVVRQGEDSDSVFFVIDGVALVVEQGQETVTELSRIGPGQCFGEVGVLEEAPRSATVIAETPLRLLRVDAQEFLDWHRRHPHLREFLATLRRVYRIRDGRLLSVYRGDFNGVPTITTVQGDPGGECIISTKVVEKDIVLFARRPASAEFQAVEFMSTDESTNRVLHVDEASGDGPTAAGRLIGVTSRGVRPDLAVLYAAVVEGAALSRRDLNVFRSTGHLGGRRDRNDPDMLCSCLRVTARDIDALEDDLSDSFETVQAGLGVGLVCGGCESTVAEHLADSPSVPEAGAIAAGTTHATIAVSEPDLSFDADLIRSVRGTVELQVAAAASANSNPGERFLIATLTEARPLIDDPELAADIDVFLEQEANHIRWHSELNTILTRDVFPDAAQLERARKLPLSSYGRFSLKTRLAVSAASEHAADAFFAGMFERYYSAEGTIHDDSAVDRAMRDGGIGELFAWHGREELDHRHVAFDVMTAIGTPYRTRVQGFGLLVASLLRHQVPALLAMRRVSGPSWRTYLRDVARLGKGTSGRLFRYLKPGFHPSEADYEFMDQLRADTAHIPSGS